MSEENVEIVRRMLEAWRLGTERNDPAAIFESGTVAADLEWIPSREFPGPKSYRSREGVVEYFRTWTEGFDGWLFEIERLIEAPGDCVVALVHQTATGKGSGASVEMDTGFVYELEAGQVIRIRNYLDFAQALEAAGLSE
jgi:ketosteroid isomerase-like protein